MFKLQYPIGQTMETLAKLAGEMVRAWFSPDGTCIVTTSSAMTAGVWAVFSSGAGAPPEGFSDFLRCIALVRLNSDRELETLKSADWLALRKQLHGVLRATPSSGSPCLHHPSKKVREWRSAMRSDYAQPE